MFTSATPHPPAQATRTANAAIRHQATAEGMVQLLARDGQRDRAAALAANKAEAKATVSLIGARVEASSALDAKQRETANAKAAWEQQAAGEERARSSQTRKRFEAEAAAQAQRMAHDAKQAETTTRLAASEAKSVSGLADS